MLKRLILVVCLVAAQVGGSQKAYAGNYSDEVISCISNWKESCNSPDLSFAFCQYYFLAGKHERMLRMCRNADQQGVLQANDILAMYHQAYEKLSVKKNEDFYKRHQSVITASILTTYYYDDGDFQSIIDRFDGKGLGGLSYHKPAMNHLDRREFISLEASLYNSSLVTLANIFLNNHGLPQDHVKAVQYLKKISSAGDIKDQKPFIALLYRLGIGMDVNDKKGKKYAKFFAQKDRMIKHKPFLEMLHVYNEGYFIVPPSRKCEALFFEKKYKASYKECVKADKDDLAAQLILARHYLGGLGVKGDLNKAESILKTLVEKKHQPANYFIGVLYENTDYLSYDLNKAIEYYNKNDHLKDSSYRLARIYGDKDGSFFNAVKSNEYMRVAAIQGEPEAMFVMFQSAADEDKHYEYIEWLKRAAIHKHKGAIRLLSKYPEAERRYVALSKELDQLLNYLPNGL